MVICFCANDDSSFACSSNSTCEVNGYCFSSLEITYDEQDRPIDLRRSAGCLYNNESGLLLCKTKLAKLNYTCCKDADLCNEAAYLAKTDLRTMIGGLEGSNEWTTSFLLALSIVLLFVAASLVLVWIGQSRRLQSRRKRNRCECLESNLLFVGDGLEERRMEGRKLDARSNRNRRSGDCLSGLESIAEKSQLFNELAFQCELSSGRFVSKHRARRHGTDVFVKIYRGERTKRLWANEVNIYKIILIRHENILNFVAKSQFYDPQLNQIHYLTVTGYHHLGSLASFLNSKPSLSEPQMLGLLLSASSGLNHLHLEISSNQRKASIVHRNINAKNFIIKQDLTCALANFNHAIKSTELDGIGCECHPERPRNASLRPAEEASSEKICKESVQNEQADEHEKSAKTCKRCKSLTICKIVADPLVYCPPEYLSNSINLKSIVSLKSADIYSFGLVLWQIANYFYTGAYRVPFCQESADRNATRSSEVRHHENVCGSDFEDSRDAPRDEEPVKRANAERANAERANAERAKAERTNSESTRASTQNAELKRLKYLLLERKPSDDLSIEAMFACDRPSDERPSSSPKASDCLRPTKFGFMIDEPDGLNASEAKRMFADKQVDEDETKEIGKGTTFACGQYWSIKSELSRIIRESTYIEPLSRLSIRKIESDLNRLLQQ